MVYGGHHGLSCESQCPPCVMEIQPPSFCLTIPGPCLSCYNEPVAVDCNTPCAYGCGSGWGGYGGYGGGYGGYGGHGGRGGCGYGQGFGGYGGWGGRWGQCCGGWGW